MNISKEEAYLEWYATQCAAVCPGGRETKMWVFDDPRLHALRAPGNTCLSALRAYLSDHAPEKAENNSKGCGTVMRAAPFGLMHFAGDDEAANEQTVIDMAIYDALLTHGHPDAAGSSAVLAQAVYQIVNNRDSFERLEDVFAVCKGGTDRVNRCGLRQYSRGMARLRSCGCSIYSG